MCVCDFGWEGEMLASKLGCYLISDSSACLLQAKETEEMR